MNAVSIVQGWLWAVLVFCALLVGGCDGDGPVEPEGPTFAEIQNDVFTPSCAGCHSGSNAPEGLDLTANAAFDDIVNVTSEQVSELMRVDPGNAEDSYLYIKIIGGDRMAPGTFQMPIGSDLSDDQIRLVREWIDAGAER